MAPAGPGRTAGARDRHRATNTFHSQPPRSDPLSTSTTPSKWEKARLELHDALSWSYCSLLDSLRPSSVSSVPKVQFCSGVRVENSYPKKVSERGKFWSKLWGYEFS